MSGVTVAGTGEGLRRHLINGPDEHLPPLLGPCPTLHGRLALSGRALADRGQGRLVDDRGGGLLGRQLVRVGSVI